MTSSAPKFSLTEHVATFAATCPPEALSEKAVFTIKSGLIDYAGALIAGRKESAVTIMQDYVAETLLPRNESTLLFGEERASAEAAALINGTAGHALSYDDVAFMAHPSAILASAILPEAERLHRSGREAMLAYLVGYEVWGELNSRESDPCAGKGWHPTSALGIIAATAAIGHLNRLDAAKLRHAIGIATSLASGVIANFGTMTKPLHAGHAASSAIRAVRLAAKGFTSSGDALENVGGLMAALSPKGRLDLARPGELGTKFRIYDIGLSFKKYPNCYSTHRVIDSVIDLARDNKIAPADVSTVHATIGKNQAALLKNHDPVTALQAKYSLEFAVASALVAGNVGLTQLDDGFVNRADIKETMKKVSFTAIDSVCDIEPAFAVSDRIVIDLADGRRLDSGEVRFARGHALKPMVMADMERKFMDCCAATAYENPKRLLAKLQSFETVGDLGAANAAGAAAA